MSKDIDKQKFRNIEIFMNSANQALKSPARLDADIEILSNTNDNKNDNNISKKENEKKSTRANNGTRNKKMPDDYDWLNEYRKILMGNPEISDHYHDSEIKSAQSMLIWSMTLLCIIILGTIGLTAYCIYRENTNEALIVSGLGSIISVVVGFITNAFNNTLKTKKTYFDSENEINRYNRMLLLIQAITDGKNRDMVIEDVVRKFFEIEKK